MESESVRGGRVFHINKKCSCSYKLKTLHIRSNPKSENLRSNPKLFSSLGLSVRMWAFGGKFRLDPPRFRVGVGLGVPNPATKKP